MSALVVLVGLLLLAGCSDPPVREIECSEPCSMSDQEREEIRRILSEQTKGSI